MALEQAVNEIEKNEIGTNQLADATDRSLSMNHTSWFQGSPFIIANFWSPKSMFVVRIKDGSPGRSQMLMPGSRVAIVGIISNLLLLQWWRRLRKAETGPKRSRLEMTKRQEENEAHTFID
jgi:hypothetical protein